MRYLTPAKVGLLVLIQLYCEQAVPHDAIRPVLSFITSHLLDRDRGPAPDQPAARWGKAKRTADIVSSVREFEKLLAGYPFVMGLPGRRLWDQFVDRLWALDSLDTLHTFLLDLLPTLLAKSKAQLRREGRVDSEPESELEGTVIVRIARNSFLGAFVRDVNREVGEMPFADVAALWKDFVRYRRPTEAYMRRTNPHHEALDFDSVLGLHEEHGWGPVRVMGLVAAVYGDMDGRTPVSTDDVTNLLEFQIEQMQKYGSRVPVKIRKQFQGLLNDNAIIPSLNHYLNFLDAWRAGDFPTAFDLLHRYFDYTMANRDRYFYQYALMNLAVLQADFGCYDEAVAAMLETVTTARENRDMTCLNFALNWLYHFGRAHPSLVSDSLFSNNLLGDSLGSGKESLAFLRVKARETGMWTLWSSVLLSEAKLCLEQGESVASAMEYVVRSSQIIVERNMTSMMASQMALTTSVWDRLGLMSLSTSTCEVFVRCHARHSMFDEVLKVTCRLAGSLAARGRYDEALVMLGGDVDEKRDRKKKDGADKNKEKNKTKDRTDKNEEKNKDKDKNAQKEPDLGGNPGTDGLGADGRTDGLRSWRPRQYWHKYRGVIRLKRELHRGDLDAAEELLEQLLQNKHDDMEPDMAYVVDLMDVDYLTRRGDLGAALDKTQDLLEVADMNDVAVRCRLMLNKVHLLDRCGRPQRGFSLALRAASLAYRARLMAHLWEAMGLVAHLLTSLGEFEASAELLQAVIPRALECELDDLAGQLYGRLGDAQMGLAGDAKEPARGEYLTLARVAVQKSFDHYSAMEDAGKQREMMAKRAMIMKVSGDMELAADYAAAYASAYGQPDLVSD